MGLDIMDVMHGDDHPRWPVDPPGTAPTRALAGPSATGSWPGPERWPGPSSAVYLSSGPSPEAGVPPPCPGPRRDRPKLLVRALRLLLALCGCLGLLTASVMVANLTAHSWVNLPVGIGVGALSLGLLRLRRVWTPWVPLPDVEAAEGWGRRAGRKRLLAVVVGCVLLAGSVAAATVPVSPRDPMFLSPKAACGSAVLTRSLVAEKNSPLLKTPTAMFDEVLGSAAYDSDCGPARQSVQSLAIFLALVGSLVLAFTPRSRRRTTAAAWGLVAPPDKDSGRCPHRPWARWPRWSAAVFMIAVALMGGLMTVRTRDDMASANAYDRRAMVWVTAYGERITPVLATLNSMLPDEVHSDLPVLLVKCQKALEQTVAVEPVTAHVPTFLPPQLGVDIRATLDHLRRGLEDCVVASRARNLALLRRSAPPEFFAAAGASEQMSELLIVR